MCPQSKWALPLSIVILLVRTAVVQDWLDKALSFTFMFSGVAFVFVYWSTEILFVVHRIDKRLRQ